MNKLDRDFILKLEMGSDARNTETIGKELVALKIAIGILFNKLSHKDKSEFLETLRYSKNSYLTSLADMIEQFNT